LTYEPSPSEGLFHYCPFDAFWAICRSRTIWLSSVEATNDGLERDWGKEVVSRVLGENIGEFSREFRDFVLASIAEPDKHLLALLGSFSQNGDLLSQWRAYADDARGFAVQFDAQLFSSRTPVAMRRVLYDTAEQEQLVLSTLRLFNTYWKKRSDAGLLAIRDVLPDFAIDLLSLKHPSFFEEREVRAIHLLVREEDRMLDPGGHTVDQRHVQGRSVEYRSRNGVSLPYISIPLPCPAIIVGVTLGPKNELSLEEVEASLSAFGLRDVEVVRSCSPYR
jgi:hypothetical protein